MTYAINQAVLYRGALVHVSGLRSNGDVQVLVNGNEKRWVPAGELSPPDAQPAEDAQGSGNGDGSGNGGNAT